MKTYYVNYKDKVILNREIVLYYKNNKDYCDKIYVNKPYCKPYYKEINIETYDYNMNTILSEWDIVQITDLQYEKLINHDCSDYVYCYYNTNKFAVCDDRYITMQKDLIEKFIEFYNFVNKNNLWSLL